MHTIYGNPFEGGSGPLTPTIPMDAVDPDALPETEEELAPIVQDAARRMWAVVLAGGIGSRFWPLSTPERPKQLLALVTEQPLIAETVSRLAPLIPPDRVLVLTSRDISDAIAGAIPDVPPENVLVEPRPLGTAAALAWGAREVTLRAGTETVCCVMHADLTVAFREPFHAALRASAKLAARLEALVAVGVRPTRPDISLGYMVPGEPLAAGGIPRGRPCRVSAFVEKPAELRAEELLRDGALWHAGILLAKARVFGEELSAHTREVEPGLDALKAGDLTQFAGRIQSASIERGLLERTDNLVVVPAEFGWDDVGTWGCLRRARDLDDYGNGARGRAHFVDASANVVHCEGGAVVLYGVTRLLVVTMPGLTFVTTLDRANDLKPLLESLPEGMRIKPGG